MPFYEYSCKKCGDRFEMMRRLAERDDPVDCPTCGAKETRRELPRVQACVREGSSSQSSAPCGGSFG